MPTRRLQINTFHGPALSFAAAVCGHPDGTSLQKRAVSSTRKFPRDGQNTFCSRQCTRMRPDMHRDVVLKVHVVLHDDGLHLRSAGEGDRLQTSHIPHVDLVSGRKGDGFHKGFQESRILHPNLGSFGMGVDGRDCWIFRLQDFWLHFLTLVVTLRVLSRLRAWGLYGLWAQG